MAIQNRRGANEDFDSTKMLPGELAVTTDGTRKVYVAFAPGDTKELASAEEVQEIVDGFNENVEENIQKAADEIEQKKDEALAEIPNYEAKLAELETYKANSILSKSTGEVVTTTDSANVCPKNIRLYGKTEQDSTDGNQLFSGVIEDITYRDGAFVSSTLKSAIVPIQGGETYTISITTADTIFTSTTSDYPSVGVATVDAYAGSGGVKVNKKTLSTNANANYLVIGFGNGVDAHTDEIMVNKGNTALPLEKFTGGEASPNMNYEQPLNSHGASGSIVGKVLSSNIFDLEKAKIESSWIPATTNGYKGFVVQAKPNTKYTMSAKKVSDISGVYLALANQYSSFIDEQGNTIASGADSVQWLWKNNNFDVNGNKATVTTDDTGKILLVHTSAQGNINFDFLTDIQIKEGASTDYEPYTEQPFTALTPNGFMGLPVTMGGNHVDSNGQKYMANIKDYASGENIQNVYKFRLTSDLTWAYTNTTNYKNHNFQIRLEGNGFPKGYIVSDTISRAYLYATKLTHFRCKDLSFDNTGFGNEKAYVYGNELTVSFAFDSEINSLAKWKQFLDDNEVYVEYILADPIITDLTQEELDQYNALLMNYPNTTVVNDAGAYMEVEYVCDTQKHIEQNYISKAMHEEHENRIAELEKAIVNS